MDFFEIVENLRANDRRVMRRAIVGAVVAIAAALAVWSVPAHAFSQTQKNSPQLRGHVGGLNMSEKIYKKYAVVRKYKDGAVAVMEYFYTLEECTKWIDAQQPPLDWEWMISIFD